MYKMLVLTLMAAIPSSAFAQGLNAFEVECREEMNLTGVEVKPGRTKADLRRCIRLKTSESKSQRSTKRRRSTYQMQQDEIQKKVLESQQKSFGGVSRYSYDKRMKYNLDCREELEIGALDVVQPGITLGKLKRCVERKTSEASRAANVRRRRSTVRLRSKQIGSQVRQQKKADLDLELKRLDQQQRTRLKSQVKANFRQLKAIRETYRVRSFFSNKKVDTRATQKRDAQSCRKVPAKEWGTCIRNALSK